MPRTPSGWPAPSPLLTKSREEQDFASSGSARPARYAVPPLVQELQKSSHSPDEHALLVRNLGRLDTPAVPPLIATLDAPDRGRRDRRRRRAGPPRRPPAPSPHLTAAAVTGKAPDAARRAHRADHGPAVRRTAEVARPPAGRRGPAAITRHQINFPGDPVVIWAWDDAAKVTGAADRVEERCRGVVRHEVSPARRWPSTRPTVLRRSRW